MARYRSYIWRLPYNPFRSRPINRSPSNMKHIATRLLWILPAALLSTVSLAQSTAINTTGAVGAASSILDIASTAAPFRGLLIPRMSEAQRLGIPTPPAINGLWVYQIAAVGNTTPNGLWYYDATITNAGWYRMNTGTGWMQAGNTGTLPVTNFLGTTGTQALVVATNGAEAMRLHGTTGFLGIANNNPTEALSVTGAVHMTAAAPGSITLDPGVIRYNVAPALPAPFPAMNPLIPYHEGVTQYTPGPIIYTDRLENAFVEVNDDDYAGSVLNCGSGTMEIPNSAGVSVGVANGGTCFPTNPGRGSKVQYVYTRAELLTWGLCAGAITEIAFRVTSDDITAPAPASVTINIRVNNVPLGTTFVGGYHFPTSQLASMGTVTTVVSSGLLQIPVAGANWNGLGDLVVDVSYVRAAATGNSPTIQMASGFPNCGFYGYIGTAVNGSVLHATVPATAPPVGWTTLNFPALQPTCALGTLSSRAVIRFTGQAQVPTPVTLLGDYVRYDGGLLVGSAAWATTPGIFQGPGVIRAEIGVYDGNVQLSDHVFDRYFDGAPRMGEGHWGEPLVPLDKLETYLAANRHLPSMPSRRDWENNGKSSLGDLSTGLWETVEQQAIYITELNAGLKTIEARAFGERMDHNELTARIAAIQDSPRLTADEKQQLIAALRTHNANANQ